MISKNKITRKHRNIILHTIFHASTAQTTQPIVTHNSSSDAILVKKVAFVGRNINLLFRVLQPQNSSRFQLQ